jgi:hypothetical protein
MNIFYDPETGTLYMMGTVTTSCCSTGIISFSSDVMHELAQTEIAELERIFKL